MKKLNPTLIYVLSIVSLLCCCFGGLGIFLAGPAYFMANSKLKDAQLNPEAYEGDTKAMNTAKTVALVALIINLISVAWTIYTIATGGWDEFTSTFEQAMEQARQQQGIE